jgi:cell division septum initiation protein DivIVA
VDVDDKLDELTHLVEDAKAMPLSASCIVNRADVLALLDDIRGQLPETLRQADTILDDREAMIEQGHREAERIVEDAHAEQARLVSEHEVYLAAVREAEALRRDAEREADRMRREVDDYVDAKLANFEVALHKTLQAVERGRDKIRGKYDFEDAAPPRDPSD